MPRTPGVAAAGAAAVTVVVAALGAGEAARTLHATSSIPSIALRPLPPPPVPRCAGPRVAGRPRGSDRPGLGPRPHGPPLPAPAAAPHPQAPLLAGMAAAAGAFAALWARPLPTTWRPPGVLRCAAMGDDDDNEDGFRQPRVTVDIGGLSPERKAAAALTQLMTFVACRVVMLEIETLDNEGGSALHHPVWLALQDALASSKVNDALVDGLLQHPRADVRLTAVRILELRKTYAATDFNWERLRTETVALLTEGERQALRRQVERSAAPLDAAPAPGPHRD